MPIFQTPFTQYSERNGQQCEIVRPLTTADDWDEECLPAYRIRFQDGEEIDAFPDEIENAS